MPFWQWLLVGWLLFVVGIALLVWRASVSASRERAKDIDALAELRCPACGQPYGHDLAEQSRADYEAMCAEEVERHPDVCINFFDVWEVRCPACHTQARFDVRKRALRNS